MSTILRSRWAAPTAEHITAEVAPERCLHGGLRDS
jgi:hypothetical protein